MLNNLKTYFLLIFLLFATTNTNAMFKDIVLSLQDSKILEETDEVAWSSISNVSISPNQKHMAISSYRNNKYVAIYNMGSYSLRKSIFVERAFSDSVVPYINCLKKGYKVLPMKYLKETDPLPNTFKYASFLSDSIIAIFSEINYIGIPEHDEYTTPSRKISKSEAVILNKNINSPWVEFNILKSIIYQDSIKTFAQIYNFVYDNDQDNIYTITTDRPKFMSVAKYDKKGNFLNSAHLLPKTMQDSKIFLKLNYAPSMVLNNSNELLLAYPYIPIIYNSNTNKEFNLQNLKFDNTKIINKFTTDEEFNKSNMDSVYTMLQYRTRNIFIDNENRIIVFYSIFNSENGQKIVAPYIQLYTQTGELLGEKQLIYNDEIGKMEYLHFNKADNSFYIFRLGKENWIIQKYSWELK